MVSPVDYRLYVILDAAHFHGRDPGQLAARICAAGATILQYRAKGEGEAFHRERVPLILEAARRHGIPLVINDDLDLALRFEADGVHLGRGDLPVDEARKRGGDRLIVGASVHDTREAARAIADGADYLGVGSIYPTDTKADIRIVGPAVLEEICRLSSIPTVAIGGITESRLDDVLCRGPRGIAVVSAILDAPDPARATRRMRRLIERYEGLPR